MLLKYSDLLTRNQVEVLRHNYGYIIDHEGPLLETSNLFLSPR